MSITRINELRQERAALIEEARTLVEGVEDSDEKWSDENQATYARMMGDVDDLLARAERLESVEGIAPSGRIAEPPAGEISQETRDTEHAAAFETYMRTGDRGELRAHEAGTASEGGYTVPTLYEPALIRARDAANIMRQICDVRTYSNDTNVARKSDNTTAYWVAEEADATASDMTFAQSSFGAYKATGLSLVSEELLADSFMNFEVEVIEDLGRAIGVLEETAYVAGGGTTEPTGVTSGATAGKTFASATAVTADELMDLYHAAARQYRVNASWMFNDSTVLAIRKLKNAGTTDYVWQAGLQAGEPDRILGKPVHTSSDMPALGVSNVAALFGDFKLGYRIVDRPGYYSQRLNELYAVSGQVGFKTYHRTDGAVVLAAAIQKGTCSAVS